MAECAACRAHDAGGKGNRRAGAVRCPYLCFELVPGAEAVSVRRVIPRGSVADRALA